jgi:cytochrome c peroxidase
MQKPLRKISALVILLCAATHGARGDDRAPVFSEAERRLITTLAPTVLPPPPPDVTNRFADDPRAAAFGRKLFFDTRFAGRLLEGDNDGGPHTLGKKGETGRVACAGCHIPDSGFLDTRSLGKAISLAAGWGRRRAPSLYDVGHVPLLMWDGRHDAFYNQVFEAIESPVEMNSSRLFVAQQLSRNHRAEYESIFGALPRFDDPSAYPQISPEETGCRPAGTSPKLTCDGVRHGVPGDGREYDGLSPEQQEAVTRAVVNLGKAVGSYLRRLTCGPGRFDAWAHGDSAAMSVQEQRGLQLFLGKGRCVQCHSGPFLSDQKFHNVGLVPQTVAVAFRDELDDGAYAGIGKAKKDPLNSQGKFSDGDDGRLPRLVGDELKGAYKTPMLRCVTRRPTFMHTGQINSLRAAIDFFDQGGAPFRLVGVNELQPLHLSPGEKDDLLEFLKALEGSGPAPEWLRP